MTTCVEFELALSELLDGELPPALAAEAVEHAFACASCREFFRAARRLGIVAREESAVALAEDGLGAARSDESDALWERVRSAGGLGAFADQRTAGTSRWLGVAALLALGVGGGWLGRGLAAPAAPATTAASEPRPGAAVVVSTAPSNMDERRFVALADELLDADPKFQRAMLQVLRLVPALETGEGLGQEEGAGGGFVRARIDDETPRRGAI